MKYPVITIEVRQFNGIVVDSQNSAGPSALLKFNYESPLSLVPNETSIGDLRAQYTLDQSLRNGFLLWLIFLVISFPIFLQFRRNLIRIEELNTENAREAAIARTTQMLSHDVRKPFALFRMTLDQVKSARSPEQMHLALQEALPEVERSPANVNGLISDVLNVCGEFSLVLKPLRLAPIVEDVVEELRKLNPTSTMNVQTNISPETWVEADDTLLPRVFLNILANAIEAVTTTDVDLWITVQKNSGDVENAGKTISEGKNLEVRVGNAGSYIPPDACEKLFDLFYTSGKKGGTGLGLAIVKKILEAHGSTVQCISEHTDEAPHGKVEFLWRLKSAVPSSDSSNSVDLAECSKSLSTKSDLGVLVEKNTIDAVRPKVVFLDDSPLARWVWEAKLKNEVTLQSCAGPNEFWMAVSNGSVSLDEVHTIITDHYFAPDEKITGLEFAAALRERGDAGRIFLASSGEFELDKFTGIVDKLIDKQPLHWNKLNT